jgi:hypothetical protein
MCDIFHETRGTKRDCGQLRPSTTPLCIIIIIVVIIVSSISSSLCVALRKNRTASSRPYALWLPLRRMLLLLLLPLQLHLQRLCGL